MANRTYHPRGETVDGLPVGNHPLYATWARMLSRCYSQTDAAYPDYGARGIVVHPSWHHFANFARDMGPKPSPEYTLERRDNDKGYGPDNCVWASRSEQGLNRRKFSNNTSGYTGVVRYGSRFEARFDYEQRRYRLGRFDTAEEAAAVRSAFAGLFFADREAAMSMVAENVLWCTSTTGVRGVSRHADGGFLARATVNGVREYLGYFKTVEEAQAAIENRKAQAKAGAIPSA